MLETDMNIVSEERKRIIEEAQKLKMEKKSESKKQSAENKIIATDSDESVDLQDMKLDKSHASCNLDEIEGIIFGGFNSRFWMLRKHVNMTPSGELNNLPFYCWNCITLLLPHRCGDVDLVIKSETHMRIIIKLLVHSLRTINGHKDTALVIIEQLNKQGIRDYTKLMRKEIPKYKLVDILE